MGRFAIEFKLLKHQVSRQMTSQPLAMFPTVRAGEPHNLGRSYVMPSVHQSRPNAQMTGDHSFFFSFKRTTQVPASKLV